MTRRPPLPHRLGQGRPRIPRVWAALAPLVFALLFLARPPAATGDEPEPGSWSWPAQPSSVVAQFDPPSSDYGAGHRGIDLQATTGAAVRAVDDGVVAFAADLAGRGVVSIDHRSGLRSTYEPLTPTVRRGQRVSRGDVIGYLAVTKSHCLPDACLHLGARVGDGYVDPLPLLGGAEIRLKPLGGDSGPDTPGTAATPDAPVSRPPSGPWRVATSLARRVDAWAANY